MNQKERRMYMIEYLREEIPAGKRIEIPSSEEEQKQFLRALMNVRMPGPIGEEFLKVQDEYLTEAAKEKGIVCFEELEPIQEGIYLWQGDITRLAVDAIVNAANSGMTGCYQPNHMCIDNCIHTFAGVQLRQFCTDMMGKQGHSEPTGQARITPAYNLPCKYILHTVGPIIYGTVDPKEGVGAEAEELLASCYRSCLALAEENHLTSVAFCCISTGIFRFPNQRAAEIAIQTVKEFQKEQKEQMNVVFCVFKEEDYEIYRKLLQG